MAGEYKPESTVREIKSIKKDIRKAAHSNGRQFVKKGHISYVNHDYSTNRYDRLENVTNKRLYRELRLAMASFGLNQADVANEILKKSTSYVDRRFNGEHPWNFEDGYRIMEALNLPADQMPKYFPKGGRERS